MAPPPLPPHDAELEAALVGALLVDDDATPAAAGIVRPGDLYVHSLRAVYEAILALRARGERADVLTVAAELERTGHLEDAGGDARLAELMGAMPTALNVETYALRVADLAERRRLLDAASAIAKAAYSGGVELDSVRRTAMASVTGAMRLQSALEKSDLAAAAARWLGELEELVTTGNVTGIESGIPALDRLTNGWRPGQLSVIAAPPGGGKSTLMKMAAIHGARKQGKRVGVWTLEMPAHEWLEMVMAEWMRRDISPAGVLALTPAARHQLLSAASHAAGAMVDQLKDTLSIHYRPGIAVDQWALEAREMKAVGGLDLAIVDYIQIMRAAPGPKDQSREQQVASVALTLKQVAGELGVAVIAGSQLNDAGQVRESRTIEQHADRLIVLEQGADGFAAVLRKNRRGATDRVPLVFRKDLSHIGGVTRDDTEL